MSRSWISAGGQRGRIVPPEPKQRPANPEPQIPAPSGRALLREVSQGLQIFRDLREGILTGDYPPGTKLPSMHAIAESYGVTETLAQKAMERLRDMGLLRTEPGKGTWVPDRITDIAYMRGVFAAVREGEAPVDVFGPDAGPLVQFPAAWLARLLDRDNDRWGESKRW